MDGDGNVVANSFSTPSSIRLKTNIRPIESPLGKLTRLSGVTFDWKGSRKQDIGLIAEEVEAVMPELVHQGEGQNDSLSVDYGRLTALLVEAIKEQQNQIDLLRSEVESLKTRAPK